MNRAWPFLVLLLATTGQVASARTAISILDSEIRCKCGFEVGLQNGKPMLIELIEDNGIVDFCDSKGQDECADYCRNQFSPNRNEVVSLNMIPKGYSLPLGGIICGRLTDGLVDSRQAVLVSHLGCRAKFFLLTTNQNRRRSTGYTLDNSVRCRNGNPAGQNDQQQYPPNIPSEGQNRTNYEQSNDRPSNQQPPPPEKPNWYSFLPSMPSMPSIPPIPPIHNVLPQWYGPEKYPENQANSRPHNQSDIEGTHNRVPNLEPNQNRPPTNGKPVNPIHPGHPLLNQQFLRDVFDGRPWHGSGEYPSNYPPNSQPNQIPSNRPPQEGLRPHQVTSPDAPNLFQTHYNGRPLFPFFGNPGQTSAPNQPGHQSSNPGQPAYPSNSLTYTTPPPANQLGAPKWETQPLFRNPNQANDPLPILSSPTSNESQSNKLTNNDEKPNVL